MESDNMTEAPSPRSELMDDFVNTFKKHVINISSQSINQDLIDDLNNLQIFPPIPQETNFAFFLFSLFLAMIWVTYITFFNSRVVGGFFTRIINKFFMDKNGYIKVGSLSFSVMAGKIMFREFAYITPDWSVRALDGYIIFRWWRTYVPKDVSEDLSHSDTRLSVQLNGFELHVYNRSHLYQNLEKTFGLEPGILPESDEKESSTQDESGTQIDTSEYILGKNWRDLIPVIKVDISTGKFVFGNRLLPTTLLVSFEEGHFTYSTKPANSNLDHFMHFVKVDAENTKVYLAESPKYTGLRSHDEAPRNMGEGFVMLASNRVKLYYYMDEAGLVPEQEELLTLPSGEMVEPQPPSWGLDIQCGKATDISYGPWADRQREYLYKFFFPPDYTPMKATGPKRPGERREAKKFDIRFSTLQEATLDLLFSKDKETKAIYMNISQGSYFEFTIPWVLENSTGYTSNLKGTLMNPKASTSLAYRELLQCETLEFEVDMHYPQYWNLKQEWNFSFTVSRASLAFVFAHKWFFQDLIEDWSSRSPPDLFSFVPYNWNFQFIIKDFEAFTPANEYNWIDTSSTGPENSHLAVCGKLLSVTFTLPFTEFVPEVIPFLFNISGEGLDLVLNIPDTSSTHHILTTLDNEIKYINRDGNISWKRDLQAGKWRSRCSYTDGWIDCWCVPNLSLTITFLFHPITMPGPKTQADIETPEQEMNLLGPLRPEEPAPSPFPGESSSSQDPDFDPNGMDPDVCKVDLEVGPSIVFLYGTLIRNFMHVKENLFGENQEFTQMTDQVPDKKEEAKQKPFDSRDYRPLNLTLDITVHDLQANLVKYCAASEPPCPLLCAEKLVFEMDKSFRETRLQLVLSPVLLKISDLIEKFDATDKPAHPIHLSHLSRQHSIPEEDEGKPSNLREGFLVLTGLQFRGHAMFSELDRPLGGDTIEYAWLMELSCGNLCGKVTIPQLYNLVMSVETLLYLTLDKENVMKHPRPYKICQHNRKQKECEESYEDMLCPTDTEVKYMMFRASVDLVDINIVEKSAALRLQFCPLRLSTCNLHGQETHQGVTAIVNNVQLHQYVSSNMKCTRTDSCKEHHQDIWVEAGSIKIGPIYLEAALATHLLRNSKFQINQHSYLQKHDKKTKKLWFLWPWSVVQDKALVEGKCGCVGGANFFGSNQNGKTFFRPNREEIKSCHNVALACVREDRFNSPGFGQSIIHHKTGLLYPSRRPSGNPQEHNDFSLPESWPTICHEPAMLKPCPQLKPASRTDSVTRAGGRLTGRKSIPSTPHGASTLSLRKRKSFAETDPSGRSHHHRAPMHRAASVVGEHPSTSTDTDRPSSRSSASPHIVRMQSIPLASPDPEQFGTAEEQLAATSAPSKESISNLHRYAGSTETISRSVSTSSFMSAMSEQENMDNAYHEDFGLVNLHLQGNKQITEFPILMSSYLTHLTQIRCVHIDQKYQTKEIRQKPMLEFSDTLLTNLPGFEMMVEGFSCIKMLDKEGEEYNHPIPTPTHPQQFTWGDDLLSQGDTDSDSPSGDKDTLLQSINNTNTSKTTILVQFRDSVDIVASPIMLEGLQQCVDSLTPTFEVLHPLTVINHLHATSLERVEENNTLKKEKSLDLQDKVIASDIRTKETQRNIPYQSVSRTFEKSIASSIQGSMMMPKINLLMLQACVIEESCTFSALDKVRDITCVSLLALGIKDVSFKFHKTSQSKKIVKVLSHTDKIPIGKKRKPKMKRIAQLPTGNIAFESSETQLEETILSGSISKIHTQLRRLKNDSSLLKEAAITAIPDHKSKVFFDYVNVPAMSALLDPHGVDVKQQELNDEFHPLGFNMCEFGLEGVTIGISKKSSNNDKELKDLTEKDKGDEEKVIIEDEILTATVTAAESTTEVEMMEDLSPIKDSLSTQQETVTTANLEKGPSSPKDKRPSSPREKVKIEADVNNGVGSPEEKELKPEKFADYQGKKSKSSGSVKLKTVWFNFAAPPKKPIAKKMNFTKLDWNLLSTGSPGIDAWLNPAIRFQNSISFLVNRYNTRVGAIIASVMAEALEAQELHFAKSSKYDNLTALAKTFKEDPSCQLCSVLLRYVKQKGLKEIEANLDPKIIPPLINIRQGIVVLSRQWKNVIYTPILIEYNLKTSGMKNLYRHDVNVDISEELDDTSDEDEGFSDLETDEETALLKSQYSKVANIFQEGSITSNFSYLKERKGMRSSGYKSPAYDDILVLLESGGGGGGAGGGSRPKGGSIYSDDSIAVKSAKSAKIMSGPSSPMVRNKSLKKLEEGEDLYHWLKRQQNDVEMATENLDNNDENNEKSAKIDKTIKTKYNLGGQNSTPALGNAFLDAHIIFEPLLSSLGLMPQQMTNLSLKNLGTQIVCTVAVDTFQISLVESEIGKEPRQGKVKLNLEPEVNNSQAFVCQKISMKVDVKKITDIMKGGRGGREEVMPLYVSRNQLKRHTSSFANLTIEVDYISQSVNMPLLRLVNQIVTMHLNAKETNEELREKRTSVVKEPYINKHTKHSSSGSSVASEVGSTLLRPASDVGSSLYRPEELSGSSAHLPVKSVHSNPSQSTPSPSVALKSSLKTQRPKSLASKFRSNSRLGGYASLGESPQQDQQDAFLLSGHPLEKITEEQVTKCWKTIYCLLDLYATLPETKFIDQRHSITQLADISLLQRSRMKYAQMKSNELVKTPDKSPTKIKEVSFARPEYLKEHFPLVIVGEAKINRINLTATLSGLKLEGEITGLGSSLSYKERVKGLQKGVIVDAQINGKVNETTIALLEGSPSHQQTVVKVTIKSSSVNYKTHMSKKDKNDGSLIIGPVDVNIPQHPVTLHGIMTRSTKQLTNTLKEFKGTRILYKGKTTLDDSDYGAQGSPKMKEPHFTMEKDKTEDTEKQEKSQLLKPLVMTFFLEIESFAVSAALLPSLHAEYKMEKVVSKGLTGSKAKFSVLLPRHKLSFTTRLEETLERETNLPSEASIDLPKVHVVAEYIQDEFVGSGQETRKGADGSMYSKGNYFKADAEIGELDHGLTTDMLNHLVFVQKVFMKEVNEVVQKMSGGDVLVPVWTEFGDEFELYHSTQPAKQLLYTVSVKLKRITITATTPSNSAVRFETGTSELVLSNRIANVQGSKSGVNKISTNAKIFLKLSLGQVIKDIIYPEAEPQFQQHAYFKTTIHMRNALEDDSVTEESSIPDKEVILITCYRPLIFFQPIAVDKAILVWLSYKNAWEYWAEQRSNLNKEVLVATQQVIERVPISHIKEQISSQHIGTLFLQLNVTDIGIAVPLMSDPNSRSDNETKGAIVCTVETTSISACSAQSMVSKGKFDDLCIRFAEDFNHTLDDWKPDRKDENLLNLCTVSKGSYEVCSKTHKAKLDEKTKMVNNAKLILNIKWQMTGVDVKVDTGIGKHLSALGHTLTTLTGEEDEITEDSSISDDIDSDVILVDDTAAVKKRAIQIENLPNFVFDASIDPAQRAKKMREEMLEQSKIIEDLKKLGASDKTVDIECKKLSDMEAFASKDFRKEMVQKFRRQSARTQSIKEKFGWGGSDRTPTGPPTRGIMLRGRSLYPPMQDNDDMSFEESVRARLESGSREANDTLGDEVEEKDLLKVSPPTQSARERKKAFYERKCHTISEDVTFYPEDEQSNIMEDIRDNISPKHQPSTSVDKKGPTEPNVDYIFDFKIFINYGKCILHTKMEEESKKGKKDKSSNFYDPSDSPLSQRKFRHYSDKDKSKNKDRSTLSVNREIATIFYIPGLDVKVHFTSKTDPDLEIVNLDIPTRESECNQQGMSRLNSRKKAVLSAWVTLQSIPEKTIITPAILEFLEQAIEPISNISKFGWSANAVDIVDDSTNEDIQTTTISYPVDVIVYFHMKSNQFQFSCMPVSRVECMLTLPSLDLVFSSKRSDLDCIEDHSGGNAFVSLKREQSANNLEDNKKKENTGGLSVTGCLADFSVHVFHPYGGGYLKGANASAQERKDSLSVQVAFVKFHISRSRKLAFEKLNRDTSSKLPKQISDPFGKACVRFSTTVDIGKATFNYDMRKLTEILAFPKAWYRRTLVRRLFLGEQKATHIYADFDSPADFTHDIHFGSGGHKTDQSPSSPQENIFHGRKQSLVPGSQVGTPNLKRQTPTTTKSKSKANLLEKQNSQSWETLVLFAVKFKELEVGMNMGNVMGTVSWISKDFTSEGRLSIGSSGHKDLFIGIGLEGSSLEAKGGIIGGLLNLGKIDQYARVLEDHGQEPKHKIGIKLDAMEVRVDYMGTSVLMGRVSHLNVSLANEWQVCQGPAQSGAAPSTPDSTGGGSFNKSMVYIFGDLKWDQLQLMISKSTNADLLKIFYKLEEFFVQQFKSSKRVLSILEPWPGRSAGPGIKLGKRSSNSMRSSTSQTVSHHRHWQHALERASGVKIKNLAIPLPKSGSILGGRMELLGKHISLACFHGINFKAKNWALFSLKDPFISFNSEAQGVVVDNNKATSIEQQMVFSLGMADSIAFAQHESMAKVCKISRNYMYSPQFKTLSEWFCYAFKNSDLDEVERFPVISNSADHQKQGLSRDKGPYNQSLEIIFAVPCMSMILKSGHIQKEHAPTSEDPRPVVKCTFITEFEDHIYVTVDAEAFFFLHDLIISYVKEKDRVLSNQTGITQPSSSNHSSKGGGESSTPDDKKGDSSSKEKSDSSSFQNDWRNFECQTWRLEPTVRLQSLAGRHIEPYGVDYILQRLGFTHAKTTIPKWLQRGFMDPLDKVLSVIVLRAISMVSEDQERDTNTDEARLHRT